jgi:peptidoglycan/xylan/chitin deacetylase (PgdA/CDA1 family)
VTPAHWWSCSLGLSALVWGAFPAHRGWLSLPLLAHVPWLAWGIADIRSQFFGRVHCSGSSAAGQVALTFDDGPDESATPDVLDMLGEFGCPATFFVVASRAARHPDLVRRASGLGHTIACHDLHHAWNSNFRRGARLRRDLAEAQSTIGDIIGRKPLLYRPPVGLLNPHLLPALARTGMHCVGWSRSARDGGNRVPFALDRIPRLAGPGEVVLLHDCLPRPTLHARFTRNLRLLLERLKRDGLVATTVDHLLSLPAYG